MDLLLNNPLEYLDIFFLIFIRISCLFIAIPIFSNRNIPVIAKLGLSFFVSLIVLNLYDFQHTYTTTDPIPYGIAMLKEAFVGWLIGFGAYMVFSILTLAGQFIDQEMGFSMVNVFDPMSQIQLSITGTFYFYLLTTMTLVTNGHYYFFKAIIRSYEWIPIGSVTLSPALRESVTGFMNNFFIIALQIAAPFFFIILVSDVILGILARTAPQMNLFVIGFPIKILLGLGVLLITINIFTTVTSIISENTQSLMDKIIRGMMP